MKKILIALVLIIGLGGVAYTQRITIREYIFSAQKPALPEAQPYAEVLSTTTTAVPDRTTASPSTPNAEDEPPSMAATSTPHINTIAIKPQVNLAVPFQAQAPFANWVEPYKEACEEASLIMVDYFMRGEDLSKQQMQDEIDRQITWQHDQWGGHYDLPISQVQELGRAMYNYTFDVIPNLSVQRIKEQLSLGRPVIVPSAGRELGNPNFRAPGPLYHMLVIKGYTLDGKFITNDPGTRKGADYIYDADVLLAAIRDWTGQAPDGGAIGLIMY